MEDLPIIAAMRLASNTIEWMPSGILSMIATYTHKEQYSLSKDNKSVLVGGETITFPLPTTSHGVETIGIELVGGNVVIIATLTSHSDEHVAGIKRTRYVASISPITRVCSVLSSEDVMGIFTLIGVSSDGIIYASRRIIVFEVYSYDPKTNIWSKLPGEPHGNRRWEYSGVVHKDSVYADGGNYPCERFDIKEEKWTHEGRIIPEWRSSILVSIRDWIFVITCSAIDTGRINRYSPTTKTTELPHWSLPAAIFGLCKVRYQNGSLYVAGKWTTADGEVTQTYVCDVDSKGNLLPWRVFTNPGGVDGVIPLFV